MSEAQLLTWSRRQGAEAAGAMCHFVLFGLSFPTRNGAVSARRLRVDRWRLTAACMCAAATVRASCLRRSSVCARHTPSASQACQQCNGGDRWCCVRHCAM